MKMEKEDIPIVNPEKPEVNSAIPAGIDFGIIGLGQCGGNLAEEFYLRGYRTIALNSSYTDLRAGKLPAVKRYHVGIQGRDGAGQDLELGERYLRSNAKRIVETVEKELGDTDILMLMSGLAGGTGGNLGVLTDILGDLEKPMCVLTVLPDKVEGAIAKINAVRALKKLAQSPVDSIILLDNHRVMTQLTDSPVSSLYSRANSITAAGIDWINRITRHPGLNPIRSFDSEDFRKFFLTRGIMVIGETLISTEESSGKMQLSLNLKEILGGSGFYARDSRGKGPGYAE